MIIQKPRGTQDYFDGEFNLRRELEKKFFEFFALKGYKGLETPIFEQKNLFVRSVGEETDIVSKELFDLAKKSDEVYSLRPEFTAGVIRSLIELGVKSMPLPIKVLSYGACFRYERPQKGRKRQFNQLNIEMIGKKSAELDFEIISDSIEFLIFVGVKNPIVNLNTFGNIEAREKYSLKLKKYLKTSRGLCDLCKKRTQTNPLRVLDCKNEQCQKVVAAGPEISDQLEVTEKQGFEKIVADLKSKWKGKAEIAYAKSLVRGLDYYTGIVFELNAQGDESRVNSIGGGGRYDTLIKDLGGPDLPAIGYGLGFDRILEAINSKL